MLLTQENDAFCKTFHTKQCNSLIHTSFLYDKTTKGEFSVAKQQEIVTINVYNDDEGSNFVSISDLKKNSCIDNGTGYTPLLLCFSKEFLVLFLWCISIYNFWECSMSLWNYQFSDCIININNKV